MISRTKTTLAAALLLGEFLVGCAGALPSRPSSPGPHVVPAIRDKVLLLMEKHRVPGVAVAIIERGSLRSVEGFGYTDRTRTRRVDSSTVFEAASLGKPLFAYAVVQRTRAGQLDLDAAVENYSDSRLAVDPEGRNITAAHLLSHTSGLIFSEPEGRRRVATRPGLAWQYSGQGFLVLQQAIESTSLLSVDALVHQAITGPLEMRQTTFSWSDRESTLLAKGHDRQGRELPQTTWATANAASSLHTTVVDYARFVERMFADLAPGSGTPTVGRVMLQSRVQVDATLGLWWGLGWGLARANDEMFFLHWGSNPGYKSLVLASLDQQRAVVILTNGDNGLEVATDLAPVVFGREYPFLQFYMLHPDD